MTRKHAPLSLAIAIALAASPAFAQDAPATQDARTLDTLIVTGTRVTDRTVANHLTHIYAKLHVTNRTELGKLLGIDPT